MTTRAVEILSRLALQIRTPNVARHYRQAQQRQWWSHEQLLDDQKAKLLALLQHCKADVPYYQQRLSDLSPENMVADALQTLNEAPLLTKELLRQEQQQLKAKTTHVQRSKEIASGGSTGNPVRFLMDLDLFDQVEAHLRLVFSWAGWKPGEMVLHFWGDNHASLTVGGWKAFRAKLAGRAIIPVCDYDERDFEQWWRMSQHYRPTIIYGYPSVIANYAAWLIEKGRRTQKVKGVFTTAEMLLPQHRKLMETAFSCKVFNQYGSREAPGIACECEQGNIHLFIDNNVVEFIPETQDSAALSRIVVTPLHKYAQPLLRYELGDLGTATTEECSCGRHYPLMERLTGRERDHLIATDGRRIYPGFFTRLMDDKRWVRAFQFNQNSPVQIELLLETVESEQIEPLLQQISAELAPKITEKMGSKVRLNVRSVERIARTPLGKFRYVANRIQDEP
ncbi:MAG: hypothetical protein OET90_04535 [Desulfuromonadales bacterium]|nr:hypothetical protein [Desulfuromonadales bacterium]